MSWTQTLVTIPPSTSTQLVGQSSQRVRLRWMVTGTNPVTVSPGAAPITSITGGVPYNPASAAGQQGSSDDMGLDSCQDAFQAYSALGSTVTVWEETPNTSGLASTATVNPITGALIYS